MRHHNYWFFSIVLMVLVTGLPGISWGTGPYVDNGNGTVTDQGTGLMWQKADDGNTYTWRYALQYCEDLSLAGYADWRLPNIRELQSLVDRSTSSPAIDPIFECRLNDYWSSTSERDYGYRAWHTHFHYGLGETGEYKNTYMYVRCVRDGLAGYQLNVLFQGKGSGTVTIDPPGTVCTSACSQTYIYAQEVTLTATPDEDMRFYGWSGDCSGTRPCTLTMRENKTVSARFNRLIEVPGGQPARNSLLLID